MPSSTIRSMRSRRRSRCSWRSPIRRRPPASASPFALVSTPGVEEQRDDDYFGRAVNRAARIMAVAHGGQILVSQAVALLISERLPAGVTLRDLGDVRLRDLAKPERVFQIAHPALRADFPALRALTTTPSNLPQQLTSFVDREDESAEIADLLAKNRLRDAAGRGRHRQDAAVAQGRRRGHRRLSGWRVAGRAGGDQRRPPRAAGGGDGAGRQGGGRARRRRGAGQVRSRPDAAHRPRQLRASGAGVRGAREPSRCRQGPTCRILASSREPLHVRGEAIFPLRAVADSRCATRPSSGTRWNSSRRHGCSSTGARGAA